MKKLVLVSVLSLFMMVGCSNENGNEANNSNENVSDIPVVEESVDKGEESTTETSNNENTSEKNPSESENNGSEEAKTEEFKIYGFDKNVENKTVVGTVSIDKSLSKDEKVKVLFNDIYKNHGGKFKIEIGIRDNIAELNILNVDEIQGDLTTSAQTEGFIYTFIDSLLQKEYTGDWISGVQVLNNGEIDPELGQGAFEEVYKR